MREKNIKANKSLGKPEYCFTLFASGSGNIHKPVPDGLRNPSQGTNTS